VKDAYGDKQCDFVVLGNDTGIMTPAALAFTGVAAAALRDGACFGMSLAIEQMLHHYENINAAMGLPAGAVPRIHNLVNNGNLTNFIETRHLYQLSMEVIKDFLVWQTSSHNNASVYDNVMSRLMAGDHPLISLQEGIGKGHAVVAYDVEGSPNDFWIDVYDPNRPALANEGRKGSLDSRIHVVDGQWGLTMSDGSNWTGGLKSIMVLGYDQLPEIPSLPTNLSSLGGLIFGAAAPELQGELAGPDFTLVSASQRHPLGGEAIGPMVADHNEA